ncbi:GspE/PulE family protein [Vibrio nigripulchritudo]|uniref:GspE/PulE family protein n=1 Tax=Vibrio nigripulchritudo TaxID=28173 RepID=UPI00190B8419|nr:ATPase, T2SS/T4P/T4SS family [Vibrio nigripulchritudo]
MDLNKVEFDYEILKEYHSTLVNNGVIALVSKSGQIFVTEIKLRGSIQLLIPLFEAVEKKYGEKSLIPTDEQLLSSKYQQIKGMITEHGESASRSDVALMFTQYMQKGVNIGATDVHFILCSGELKVRFRVDTKIAPRFDELRGYEVGERLITSVISRSRSGSDLVEDAPQGKKIHELLEVDGIKVPMMLRAESTPIDSPNVEETRARALFVRITKSETPKTLEELDVDLPLRKAITEAMRRPKGLILVTGPTGSGKTTLLGGAIHELPDGKTLRTVEDPVELKFTGINPNITQVSADKAQWDVHLESILRQDPDAVLLGEIRNLNQAMMLIRTANTGHLGLSTLHTSNCVQTIDRLINLGVPMDDLLAEGMLSLLVACKLAPRTCKKCALRAHELTDEQQQKLKLLNLSDKELTKLRFVNEKCVPGEWSNHKPTTCDCNAGTKGVVSVSEFLRVTLPLLNHIRQNGIAGLSGHLRKHGWIGMEEIALSKVKQGTLDPFALITEVVDLFKFFGSTESEVLSFKSDFDGFYGDAGKIEDEQ